MANEFDPSRRRFLQGLAVVGTAAAIEVVKPQLLIARRVEAQSIDPASLIVLEGVASDLGSQTVERADGVNFPFENPLWRSHFSKGKGGILVDPGRFSRAEMTQYGGSMQEFNAATQDIARSRDFGGNLPEGGFAAFFGGQWKLTIRDTVIRGQTYVITAKAAPGVTHDIYIRGPYPDGLRNSDRNLTIEVDSKSESNPDGYIRGHAQYLMYMARWETNLAFIEEEQVNQYHDTINNGGTNWGAEGGTRILTHLFDVNTGFYTATWQDGIGAPIRRVRTNNLDASYPQDTFIPTRVPGGDVPWVTFR